MTYNLSGTSFDSIVIKLTAGWNLIGMINHKIDVSSIKTITEGIFKFNFYGYYGGCNPVSILQPGKGYWIKSERTLNIEVMSI